MFCKKCGNQLSSDVNFCENCGTAIKDISQEDMSEKSPSMTEILPNTENATNNTGKSKKQKSNSNIYMIVLIILIVILIASLGVFAYFYFNNERTNNNTPVGSVMENSATSTSQISSEPIESETEKAFAPYEIQISPGVAIYDRPSCNSRVIGEVSNAGLYIIVEQEQEEYEGYIFLWGKLESGEGWVELNNLTAEEDTDEAFDNYADTDDQYQDPTQYTESNEFTSYKLKITNPELEVYSGPGYEYAVINTITDKGTYTIIEESEEITWYGQSRIWGKIDVVGGWVSLSSATQTDNEEPEPEHTTSSAPQSSSSKAASSSPKEEIKTKTVVVNGVSFICPISYSYKDKSVEFSKFKITKDTDPSHSHNNYYDIEVEGNATKKFSLWYKEYDKDGYIVHEGVAALDSNKLQEKFKVSGHMSPNRSRTVRVELYIR